jgi:hypothetical protein
VSTLGITGSLMQAAAGDGSIAVLVNPTDDVGRLKVFSLSLTVQVIPEPATLLLWAAGLAGLALMRPRKARAIV